MNEADSPAVLEAVVVTESKSGYKTTEFYTSIGTAIALAIGAIPVPDDTGGPLAVLLAVAYAVSRGLAKTGCPAAVPPTAK